MVPQRKRAREEEVEVDEGQPHLTLLKRLRRPSGGSWKHQDQLVTCKVVKISQHCITLTLTLILCFSFGNDLILDTDVQAITNANTTIRGCSRKQDLGGLNF